MVKWNGLLLAVNSCSVWTKNDVFLNETSSRYFLSFFNLLSMIFSPNQSMRLVHINTINLFTTNDFFRRQSVKLVRFDCIISVLYSRQAFWLIKILVMFMLLPYTLNFFHVSCASVATLIILIQIFSVNSLKKWIETTWIDALFIITVQMITDTDYRYKSSFQNDQASVSDWSPHKLRYQVKSYC